MSGLEKKVYVWYLGAGLCCSGPGLRDCRLWDTVTQLAKTQGLMLQDVNLEVSEMGRGAVSSVTMTAG